MCWVVLSFAGLVATYWISNHSLDNDLESSSFRTVVTLMVTGLALTPLLLADAAARAAVTLRDAVSRRRGPRRQRTAS